MIIAIQPQLRAVTSIHSFINSGYFYCASLSPPLLQSAPDYSIYTVLKLTAEVLQATTSHLPKIPRVVFKPVTFWTQVTEPTTEQPCPTFIRPASTTCASCRPKAVITCLLSTSPSLKQWKIVLDSVDKNNIFQKNSLLV